MKRYIIPIILTACAVVMQGCTDMAEELPAGNLTVSKTTLWFDAEGGRQILELRTYAGSWTVSQDESSKGWCTLDKTEGTTSSSFYVETAGNPDQQREGELTVSAPGCEPVKVRLVQNGAADAQMTLIPEAPDADEPLTIIYKPVPDSPLYICM